MYAYHYELLKELPSSANYSLPGAEGTFTISGQAATLAVGLPGTEGAFTISGQAGLMAVGLSGAEGSFTINGQSAKFQVALSIHGVEGAFTIGGQPGTLNYTPIGGGTAEYEVMFFANIGKLMGH